MRGNDVEAVLDVTLEEAAAGGRRRITVHRKEQTIALQPGR